MRSSMIIIPLKLFSIKKIVLISENNSVCQMMTSSTLLEEKMLYHFVNNLDECYELLMKEIRIHV